MLRGQTAVTKSRNNKNNKNRVSDDKPRSTRVNGGGRMQIKIQGRRRQKVLEFG